MSARAIVITGTRKGLGRALAEHYLSNGDRVAGCSRGDASIEHDRYIHYRLDVQDEHAVTSMVRDVKKQFGGVDLLLNNAGIASMNHITTTPYESAANVMGTNFLGTFLFTREVGKVMMRAGKGAIVNMSTVAVPLDLEGEAVYAASKAAIESLTRISARELGEFGIRVNAIGPTPIETDLIRNVPREKIEELLKKQTIKRLGTIEDVINAIEFLSSEASNFVTGQIIYLGGVTP